jgi:hypothetical protein
MDMCWMGAHLAWIAAMVEQEGRLEEGATWAEPGKALRGLVRMPRLRECHLQLPAKQGGGVLVTMGGLQALTCI